MYAKNDIDSLLLRFLQGELDKEGQEEMLRWLHADVKHEAYFREFCKVHVYLQWTTRDDAVEGTYQGFRKKLRRRGMVMWLARVAAGVILLVGTGVGFQYLISSGEVEPVGGREESCIPAGEARATLYLSSGAVVALDSASKALRENDGTTIEVNADGSVKYNGGDGYTEDKLLMNKLVVPRRGEFNLTLADGTRVWLNSESELSYPPAFSGRERVVYLKGEAFFDVTTDRECPFVVKVNDLDVKVYGTQFNINTRREGVVETVLVEGCVSLDECGRETILHPGQKAEYDSRRGEMSVEEVDVFPYVAWREGNFVFQNESLESIMDKLKLWYGLDVIYRQEETRDVRLSGIMERYKEVNELLHFFEKSSDLRFTVSGNTVIVERRG